MDDETSSVSAESIVDETLELTISDVDKSIAPHYIKIIPAGERRTIGKMSLYEIALACSIRAQQIENGSQPLTDYTGIRDPKLIAKKELQEKKIPLKLHRQVYIEDDVVYVEEWDISELLLVHII
jgi:DNA-directed RNA polymerase subunit K/omega